MATHVTNKDDTESCCAFDFSSSPHSKRHSDMASMNPKVSELVAGSLNELSVEEREHVLEDIHGVADKFEEDKCFVDHHLKLFDDEIAKVNGKIRHAYDIARGIDRHYVSDRKLRLMFLRADEFRVQNAATRLMEHFNAKLELFGKDKLTRSIKFDDLNADDQASLCCGSHQLGFKDVRGRPVLFVHIEHMKAASWENFTRARWYQFMVSIEDEMAQKNGFQLVLIGRYSHVSVPVRQVLKFQRIMNTAIPIRFAVIHCCMSRRNNGLGPIGEHMVSIMGKNTQKCLRLHFNDTVTGLLYTLQSFGINPNTVPLEDDGRPKTSRFLDMLEKRKMLERGSLKKCINSNLSCGIPNIDVSNPTIRATSTGANMSCKSGGMEPSPQDILLGRGLKHQGNSLLDKIMESEVVSYKEAPSQFHKTCIVLSTAKKVRESGMRFLKFNNNGEWVLADDKTVTSAIASRYRSKVKRLSTGIVKSVRPPVNNRFQGLNTQRGQMVQNIQYQQQRIQYLAYLKQAQLQFALGSLKKMSGISHSNQS